MISDLGSIFANFDDWFRILTGGQSPWLVTLVVVLVCCVYRLRAMLNSERWEGKRQRKLVDELRDFLQRAIGSNRLLLDQIEEDRICAQTASYMDTIPIEEALAARGIGKQTVRHLRERGFSVVGHLLKRDVTGVFQVGRERAFSLLEWAEARYGAVYDKYAEGQAGMACDLPRDAEIDRKFDRDRRRVLQRQTALGRDVEELLAFEQEVSLFETAARQRTLGERLALMRGEFARALRRPAGALNLALVLLLFFMVAMAVPLLALAWDATAWQGASTAGLALGWLNLHVGLFCYSVLADWTELFGARPPASDRFQEQRLQFLAIRLSRRLNIAPPLVSISEGPEGEGMNAFAMGRPRGPSLVVLGDSLVAYLSETQVEAVLGHELGHLKGDHLRLGRTISMLQAPVRNLFEFILFMSCEVLRRVGHQIFTWRGRVYYARKVRLASLFYLITLVPLGIALIFITALRFVFGAVEMGASRQNEFYADRIGASVASLDGPSSMADALRRIDDYYRQRPSEPSGQYSALASSEAVRSLHLSLPPGRRFMMFFQILVWRVGSTHPATPVRVAALTSDMPMLGDTLKSYARVAGVVAASGIVLWYAVSGVRIAQDWAARDGSALVDAAMFWRSKDTPVGAASSAADYRTRRIRSPRGCYLRLGPGTDYEQLAAIRKGTECKLVSEPGTRWVEVSCRGQRGYMAKGCFRPR